MRYLERYFVATAILGFLAFSDPATCRAAESAPTYTPGLGDIMSAVQLRHSKLWFAGAGENWPLARYELDELNEAFELAERFQPKFKGRPIRELLRPTITASIKLLDAAIQQQDAARFRNAYDQLSEACTSCHEETQFGFIRIQRPSVAPLTDQRYEAVSPH